MVDGSCRYYGAKEIVKAASDSNEPYQFGIEEGNIEQFLKDRGFKLISNYTAEELEKKYLTKNDGSIFGKISGHVCLVIAAVKT